MKIGIIGDSADGCSVSEKFSQSGQNTGNLVYNYAIRKILSHPSNQLYSIPWCFSPSKVRNTVDVLVIACANQIGTHTDMRDHVNPIQDSGLPILALGLGIQSVTGHSDLTEIPSGTIDWLKAIASHSPSSYPNIFTRGDFSSAIIERFASHDVWSGCCPSLFISTEPSLGTTIKQRIAKGFCQIAIASGHTGWESLRSLEQEFVEIVTSQGSEGAYIAQSDRNLVLAGNGDFHELHQEDKQSVLDYLFGSRSVVDAKAWFAKYARVFFDTSEWIGHLRKFDLVIGARFHGIAVAYQQGIPGIVVMHDERMRELAETSGYLSAEASDAIKNLDGKWLRRKLAEFDPIAFDINRQRKAKSLCAFFHAHGVKTADHLCGIAGLRNFG